MKRGALVGGVLIVLAFAGCGSGGGPAGATGGGATSRSIPRTSPSASPAGTTSPASPTTLAAGPSTTTPGGTVGPDTAGPDTVGPDTAGPGAAASPTSAPVVSVLGGVPPSPLPRTAANAQANATYACRWFGQLAELLSDASSYRTLSAQAATDIREIAAFAAGAGVTSSYARLSRDAAALDSRPFLARLAHPADLLRSRQIGALGADCDS